MPKTRTSRSGKYNGKLDQCGTFLIFYLFNQPFHGCPPVMKMLLKFQDINDFVLLFSLE